MDGNPARRDLGDRLRALRVDTYPTGTGLAEALGWSQSRVSKLETGRKIASDYEITAWAAAVGVDETTVAQLRRLRASVLAQHPGPTAVADLTGGDAGTVPVSPNMVHLREREDLAEHVGPVLEYHPCVIPLLLSTGQVAVELMLRLPEFAGTDTLPETALRDVALRRARLQDVLYRPGGRTQVIMNEAALYAQLGSLACMVGQLDRLLELDDLETLEISIVPASRPLPVLPVSHFGIRESPRRVVVKGLLRDHVLTDAPSVDAYLSIFQLLHRQAVRGEAAMRLIRTAKASFQQRARAPAS